MKYFDKFAFHFELDKLMTDTLRLKYKNLLVLNKIYEYLIQINHLTSFRLIFLVENNQYYIVVHS